jgi:uncharacterized protein YlxW (UPF0749 family)
VIRPLATLRARLPGRRPNRWSIAVPAIFALAGLIAATSAQTARGTDLRSDGRTSTADLIREQQHRADLQQERVSALRREVAEMRRQAAPGGSRMGALARQSGSLGFAAGTSSVTGGALRVELDDASAEGGIPQGYTPDDLVVHQQDVQAVVNALWASGAEAMMLMDQRVISTSAVRCVGNVLILQDRVYSPPYRITAIGDVAAMRRSLDESAAVQVYRQYVDAIGLGYQVGDLGRQTFPGYDGSLALPYARVMGPTP